MQANNCRVMATVELFSCPEHQQCSYEGDSAVGLFTTDISQ